MLHGCELIQQTDTCICHYAGLYMHILWLLIMLLLLYKWHNSPHSYRLLRGAFSIPFVYNALVYSLHLLQNVIFKDYD